MIAPGARTVILLAALMSSGCLVGSIHPFYEPSATVTDASLVGTWVDSEQGVTIVIETGEWSSYRIAFTDRSGTQHFSGHATRIGSRELMDVLPAYGYERGELFVPLHIAFAVAVENDTLTVQPLSYDWFRRAQAAGRLTTIGGVFDAKQNVVLTRDTAAIRRFLETTRDEEMVGAEATLTRKKSP